MLNKKWIIITPWFGEFAGGAEVQAKGLAVELNNRGIETMVYTTCCKSPYMSWWEDHCEEDVYDIYGIKTYRFKTNKNKQPYENAAQKLSTGQSLTQKKKNDFFTFGINSDNLIKKIEGMLDGEYELIALPYFQSLTHSAVNTYPGSVSLIPCFHNEEQFYWDNIPVLLKNAKHIFFNSAAEKEMCLRSYGESLGKKLLRSTITGEGLKAPDIRASNSGYPGLPSRYFLYIGRKENGKNVHMLCEWFEGYKKQFGSDTRMVFIGGGDESILPKNSNFIDLGYVDETNKFNIIQNALAVINLSEKESFCLSIMEAWLMARPVLVSAQCTVTSSHAVQSNGGLSVENKEEFISALDFLENNSFAANQLGQNGLTFVKNHYSYDIVLEKYINALEE